MVESRATTGTIYTVPDGYRLHLTHGYTGTGGTLVVSKVEREVDAGSHTVIAAASVSLSGMDLWIPAGETVTCTGIAGFVGWLSPPIP